MNNMGSNFPGGGAGQMIINSTLSEGELPCPGQEVNFTCETRGSRSIAWTSEEYIEQGGNPLILATFNAVGFTRTSPINNHTVATLINNTIEDGVPVLVTTLRIIVSSQFITFSVSCSRDNGTKTTVRLQLLGKRLVCYILCKHVWRGKG